jgi:hypothetical protein
LKIFQGKQANAIESHTLQLEVALGIKDRKAPIEDRLLEVLSQVHRLARERERAAREARTWKRPAMEAARGMAKLFELAMAEAAAEDERRKR